MNIREIIPYSLPDCKDISLNESNNTGLLKDFVVNSLLEDKPIEETDYGFAVYFKRKFKEDVYQSPLKLY